MQKALSHFAILTVFALGFTQPVFAVTSSNRSIDWENANSSFNSENWTQALTELLASPSLNDSSYYYNLGTTYYHIGNFGLAVAFLEKANRIRPHHPDIQTNLRLARHSLSNKIGQGRLDPASLWFEHLADQISFDEVRATLGFLLLLLVLVWMRAYSKTHRIDKVFFHPAAYLGTAALGITFGMYLIRLWANSHPCAVLLETQAIRSGPGQHFQLLGEAEIGSKVRILGPVNQQHESTELWNQVRYSSDGIGWISSKSLIIL